MRTPLETQTDQSLTISRRGLLTAGAVMAGSAMLGNEIDSPRMNIATTYTDQTQEWDQFAYWTAKVTKLNPDGTHDVLVDDNSRAPRVAGSINKLFMAVGVMGLHDAGLRLDHRVAVPGDVLASPEAEGMEPVMTVKSLLGAMVMDSSNPAFRALQEVLPGDKLNELLWKLGFNGTELMPDPASGRHFTGITTAHDTHQVLSRLVDGSLLSDRASQHLVRLLLKTGYNWGIRRSLDGAERRLVANKYGRVSNDSVIHTGMLESNIGNEVGIVFRPHGDRIEPGMVYSFFEEMPIPRGLGKIPNLPAVMAHGRFGESMMGMVSGSVRGIRPETRTAQ